MSRKVAIGIVAALLFVALAGFLGVRSVFARDTVRMALASQMSSAIGQPVSIESIGVSFFPRVAVKLGGVSIGPPARVRAKTLRLETDLRALLSRQIVHGTVRLDAARLELPLPPLGAPATSTQTSGGGSGLPIEIVSIDEIVLSDLEIVSGGRTLRGDLELVPHDGGATLRKMSLSAGDTNITGSGEITNLAGPAGEIAIEANALNLSQALDLLSAFSNDVGVAGRTPPARNGKGPPIDLTLMVTSDRATLGELALEKPSGRVHVTGNAVTVDPIQFGFFGGGYKGTIALTGTAPPAFRLNGVLSDVDVGALTVFAGSPGVLSGQLTGRVELGAQGADVARAMSGVRGTARMDIRNGVMKGLGLVKTIVIATSMRSDAKTPSNISNDEPFSQLGATLAIANGVAHTNDLRFESPDVLMDATGSFRLNGASIDLEGLVQLSDALSRQAGRDLVRYTQEDGRVTVPVTITGSAQAPEVRIDIAGLAGRALQNKAKQELNKALDRIFRR
jgi:uncharacterized protein involved in outer membrane biogenesis